MVADFVGSPFAAAIVMAQAAGQSLAIGVAITVILGLVLGYFASDILMLMGAGAVQAAAASGTSAAMARAGNATNGAADAASVAGAVRLADAASVAGAVGTAVSTVQRLTNIRGTNR